MMKNKPNKWTKDFRKEYMRRYKREHAIKRRINNFKSVSGISDVNPEEMIKNHENRCAICLKHQNELKRTLFIDHCHKSKRVRGLLCQNCNVGIGMFGDNLQLLESAIKYLRFHKQ